MKTMPPAIRSMRVFCPCVSAMITMTPMEPIMGMTVAKIEPIPPASTWLGGFSTAISPLGSSGASVSLTAIQSPGVQSPVFVHICMYPSL